MRHAARATVGQAPVTRSLRCELISSCSCKAGELGTSGSPVRGAGFTVRLLSHSNIGNSHTDGTRTLGWNSCVQTSARWCSASPRSLEAPCRRNASPCIPPCSRVRSRTFQTAFGGSPPALAGAAVRRRSSRYSHMRSRRLSLQLRRSHRSAWDREPVLGKQPSGRCAHTGSPVRDRRRRCL